MSLNERSVQRARGGRPYCSGRSLFACRIRNIRSKRVKFFWHLFTSRNLFIQHCMKGARGWCIQKKAWIVPIAKWQVESIVKYHRARAQNYIVYPFPFVENSKRCRKVDLFMTKRVQKSLFNSVCPLVFFLVALTCHGAEKETAGPSIKDAFASVQREGEWGVGPVGVKEKRRPPQHRDAETQHRKHQISTTALAIPAAPDSPHRTHSPLRPTAACQDQIIPRLQRIPFIIGRLLFHEPTLSCVKVGGFVCLRLF